jgi:SAM-dependent methyltransferase
VENKMDLKLFYTLITNVIQEFPELSRSDILKCLDEIFQHEMTDHDKITIMTIFFEGLYQAFKEHYPLCNLILKIRNERWHKHYGVPTVIFLLSFCKEIKDSTNLFKEFHICKNDSKPWFIKPKKELLYDELNCVLTKKQVLDDIIVPPDEKKGHFLKTYNPTGGYTILPEDQYSKAFIKFVNKLAKHDVKVLEIGAGFGAATLQVLSTGATVYCNDIDPKNLAVIKKKSLELSTTQFIKEENLNLLPAEFPKELVCLPKGYFDAILISRVLHFLPGEKIEQSLQQISEYLKPNGKLFIVCETPFLKNWESFIPEYNRRVENGSYWPGEISNPMDFEKSGRADSLPSFVHWLTKDILERSLKKSNFLIEDLSYIDRTNQFPKDLLWDGRESVGAVAIKIL